MRLLGLGAAATSGLLFGAMNVAIKHGTVHPLVQTALAYFVVVALLAYFLRGLRVQPGDRLRMLAMALIGGGLAPALLFYGLLETTAIDAGMLLSLELVVTAVLAALYLGERERVLGWTGLAILLCAALVAAVAGTGAGQTTLLGAGLVALAAVAWGVDNLLSTRLVGTYEPRQLLAVKGLVGGSSAFVVALAANAPWPGPAQFGGAVAIGAVLAGGLLAFYAALRRVGAARTSAVSIPSTALAGALGGHFLLGEPLTALHAAALLLLVAGVALLVAGAGEASRTSAK